MAARYVLTKTSNDQYRFVLKAGNNETLLTSETYTAKAGALTGIDSVKTNAPNDARYERKNASSEAKGLSAAVSKWSQYSGRYRPSTRKCRISRTDRLRPPAAASVSCSARHFARCLLMTLFVDSPPHKVHVPTEATCFLAIANPPRLVTSPNVERDY